MTEQETITGLKSKLKVICGANTVYLDGMETKTLDEVLDAVGPVLNIGKDHTLVFVNGQEVKKDPKGVILAGTEEVEFQKPSGSKG